MPAFGSAAEIIAALGLGAGALTCFARSPYGADQVERSEGRPAGDQQATKQQRIGKGGNTHGQQDQGGEKWREIGENAKGLDIAMLHAPVPEEESRPDRPETKRKYR